jgi:hypothetical protein
MFGSIVYIIDVYYRLYLLVNFIEKPSRDNFMILVFFYNIYFFGYLSTLYITVIFGTYILLENRQASILLIKKINQLIAHQQNRNGNVKTLISMCQTFRRTLDRFNCPQWNQYWIMFQQFGDQLQKCTNIIIIYLWQYLSSVKIDGQLHKDLSEIGEIIRNNFFKHKT